MVRLPKPERLLPNGANHRLGRVKARMTEEFGHPSNVPVIPIEPSPGMVGRLREWSVGCVNGRPTTRCSP